MANNERLHRNPNDALHAEDLDPSVQSKKLLEESCTHCVKDHLSSVKPQTESPALPSEFNAKYEIGFEAPLGIVNKRPVHESIAIAAFINSSIHFPSGVQYDNLDQKQWEYFRGLIWNDDPSCLLLDDSQGNNHDFGIGYDFFKAFLDGPPNCMTKRSHFGNLQFLHAMATKVGESAQTTKQNLMSWLEVMYKLACGDQGISSTDQLATRFENDFNASTVPSGSATLKDLILATTPSYGWVKLERRALGICLHIIQDSYAIGHVQRRLLNPQDLAPRDAQGFIRFKPNTFGRYGAVKAFHVYIGQDEERHSHYDKLPEGAHLPIPNTLDSFNGIIGARTAIDASTKLINFFAAKTKWDDGVKQFLSDDIFALDPDVQPANTEVDPIDSNIDTMHFQHAVVVETQKEDEEFLFNGRADGKDTDEKPPNSLSLAKKLDLLEMGLADNINTAYDSSNMTGFFNYARFFGNRSRLNAVILSVVTILAFFAAAALSVGLGVLPILE